MGTLISIIVLAALVIAAAALIAGRSRKRRSEELREQFGPEYERTVELAGSPRAAERDLTERASRHDSLDLHPLSEDTRIDYLEHWREAQALFVDDPAQAIDEADALIRRVMRDRGYSDGDFDQRIGDVSVDYPEAVERYRAAHDVAIRARVGDASTEELREALTNYRGLFDELVTKSAPHEVR
jgi:hypothetical protein